MKISISQLMDTMLLLVIGSPVLTILLNRARCIISAKMAGSMRPIYLKLSSSVNHKQKGN